MRTMRIFVIVCRQTPWRTEAARQRIAAAGLDCEFFEGVHGATLGISSSLAHFDSPTHRMSAGKVALTLTKMLLWTHVAERLTDDSEPALLLEDDVIFAPDFRRELELSMSLLPEDWQVCHVGHCCITDKPAKRINDRIWEIRHPFCCHAVLWRRSGLRAALSAFRSVRLSSHSDVILARKVYPHLRHYSILPPLAFQDGTPSEAAASSSWENLSGWFDYQRIYDERLDHVRAPSVFVEVGSFAGRSTAYMASEIGRRMLPVEFWAVDTWKGTGTSEDSPDVAAAVKKAGGDLYPTFLRNMSRCGAIDWVRPLQMTSTEAAKRFASHSLDFCWIDADHSFDAVVADIRAWRSKMKPSGVLAGHDVDRDSVRRAVQQEFPGRFRTWERSWIVDGVR